MKTAIHLLNTLKRGGGENVAFNYAKVLEDLDIKSVFVAKPQDYEYEEMLRSNNIVIEYALSNHTINKADYIFVHSNINLLKLIPYKLLGKLKGKRIIYLQHLLFSEIKFRILASFINYICSDFFQITPRITALVKKYIKIPIHQIINFYNAKYDKKDYLSIRNKVRNELGIDHNEKIIIFSAIFKPGKGLKDCLTLAKMLNTDGQIKFLILGDGVERYLIDQYKINNIIHIGCVNDVERYLIASDIYLFTSSLPEMLPMALVEAINTDKHILAYDTTINRFLLHNKTYENLNTMIDAIKNNTIPSGFKYYDKTYAINCFKNILFNDNKLK